MRRRKRDKDREVFKDIILKQNGHDGKVKYLTHQQALLAANKQYARRKGKGGRNNPYSCDYCPYYHIGRKNEHSLRKATSRKKVVLHVDLESLPVYNNDQEEQSDDITPKRRKKTRKGAKKV